METNELARLSAASSVKEALKQDRSLRYEAALRKIAAWKGYTITQDHEYERYQRGYEAGANDMLSTLQAIAAEALS